MVRRKVFLEEYQSDTLKGAENYARYLRTVWGVKETRILKNRRGWTIYGKAGRGVK